MVARDISEAGSYFVFYGLPELYPGIKREPGTFPVQYLGANVPQAWAAGSVFHLLQAILGLDADAHKKLSYGERRHSSVGSEQLICNSTKEVLRGFSQLCIPLLTLGVLVVRYLHDVSQNCTVLQQNFVRP